MGRILAIDYGAKRTGLAVTDPLKIIATSLDTVPSEKVFDYLETYLQTEQVERFVVGRPTNLDGSPTDASTLVENFMLQLRARFKEIPISQIDERFTSKMASQAILQSGVNKKKRRDKGLVDRVSAVIILQSYLQTHKP